jgi:hypothetical protein
MKKIAMLAVLLAVSFVMKAQDYKPLEKVEVSDYPTNKVVFEQKEHLWGGTYFQAYHRLATRYITAELGVPPIFELIYTEKEEIKEGMIGVFSVGGVKYHIPVFFVSDMGKYGSLEKYHVTFEIKADHIKHIAVSGLQKIEYLQGGKNVHNAEFNLKEQELWRRTAEELIKGVAKFNIL